ncbi:MAG TPA: SAF domain-containing protein [Gemmataceae bacterium]|jgi:hypothetical protein
MKVLRLILPIVLGIVAAVLNFMVLRGSTAPLELTAVRSDIKADTELTEDMLERLSVRADPEIFKSAVRYSDRGLLLGRRVTRPLSAGEALLYADVQNLDEETNIRLYLRPGESTLTLPVDPSRIAPGLRRGDQVGVRMAVRPEGAKALAMPGAAPADRRILGPFRLLSLGTPIDPYRGATLGDVRMVMVAVTRMPDGQLDPSIAALDEAIVAATTPGGGQRSGALAIEYYQPAK